jgi:hypothetical protein
MIDYAMARGIELDTLPWLISSSNAGGAAPPVGVGQHFQRLAQLGQRRIGLRLSWRGRQRTGMPCVPCTATIRA